MLRFFIEPIIRRWLLSLSREFLVQARRAAAENRFAEAQILCSIAAALNNANGKLQ